MNNKIQNIVLLIFLMASNVFFAQGPDPDAMPGDSNLTDAPLHSNLVLLGILAIGFAYFVFSKKQILSSK